MPEQTEQISPKKIDEALQTLEPLLKEKPDAYIKIALAGLSGTNKQLAYDVWQNLTASSKGVAALGIHLNKRILSDLWNSPWETLKAGVTKMTTPIQSSLDAFLDPIYTVTTALGTNPDLVLKNERFKAILTEPKLWKAVTNQKEEISDYVVTNFIFPDAELHKKQISAAKPFLSEILSSLGTAIDSKPKLIKEIMNHASIILDPKELDDSKKMTALFGLLDATIEFAKAVPNLRTTLTNHNKVIADIISPYIPAGINPEKILESIFNRKALAALEKAYAQYKNNKHHIIGILKAGATIFKCPELRHLITHAAGKFIKEGILNLVPDFMRRKHANKAVNDKLAARTDKDINLSELCKPEFTELDPITRHSLKGCFKGLRLPYNLNNFTIQNFNLERATLGNNNKEFSLAGSTISNTNFQNMKLKGTSINLSGSTFDEKSFLSLLPSIKKAKAKGKEIKIGTKIKITTISKNLQKKIKKSGLDLKNFEFGPMEKKKSSLKKTIKTIHKGRKKAQRIRETPGQEPQNKNRSFVKNLMKKREKEQKTEKTKNP